MISKNLLSFEFLCLSLSIERVKCLIEYESSAVEPGKMPGTHRGEDHVTERIHQQVQHICEASGREGENDLSISAISLL